MQISELLFQKKLLQLLFPIYYYKLFCPHIGRNQKYRRIVSEHDVTVVLDWMCNNSSHLQKTDLIFIKMN